MNIKQTLKQLRQETNLTQKAFAEYFSIPVSTYEQWEMGIRKPPEYVVKMIATILNYEHIHHIDSEE